MKIGYARVSTVGQNLETQLELLEAAGVDKLYQEKKSGTTTNGRAELERALDQLRKGDVLVVTRLDRLARSLPDLFGIIRKIIDAGASFTCLQQGGVDTTTATGKLMVGILGAVAEFENDLRAERQADGIAKAKQAGKYRGKPASLPRDRVVELRANGIGPAAIARELGCSRSSVYRMIDEIEIDQRVDAEVAAAEARDEEGTCNAY